MTQQCGSCGGCGWLCIGAEWAAAVVVSAVAEQSEWPQVEGTRVLGGITGGCVTSWRVLGKIESCIDQY